MRVHLIPEALELTPGEPAALQIDVYNDREIIDAFTVGLTGLPTSSLVVEPKELSLFPGTEGSVSLVFTPDTKLAAGQRLAGVRVTSTTDRTITHDAALPINVAARTELTFDVDPQTVNGGSRADFGLILENRGNMPLSIALSGSDAERLLSCTFDRPRVDVEPGERAVARARVQGRRPFIGVPVARILTFRGTVDAENEHQAMSTFIQRPLLTRGALTFLALLAAVGIWGMVLMAGFNRVATVQTAAILDDNTTTTAAGGDDGGGGGEGDGSGGGDGGAGGAGAGAGPGAGSDPAPGPGVVVVGDGIGAITGHVSVATLGGPTTPPLNGVIVEARRMDRPDRIAAASLTDATGAFALTGVDPGNHRVRAFAPGYVTVWWPNAAVPEQAAPVVVGDDGQAAPLSMTITGAPGSISGILNSEAGPLAGATLSAGPGLASSVTGTDGRFLLQPLPTPATYLLRITAPGFPDGAASVTLGPGQQLGSQQLLLSSAAGTVAGTVTDDLGRPLGGVTLMLNDADSQLPVASSVTFSQGAVGFYTITGAPPGRYLLTATKPGFLAKAERVTLSDDVPSVNVSFQLLVERVTVTGLVTRRFADGTTCAVDCGIEGAVVLATDATGVARNATTGPDGRYEITDVRPGPNTFTIEAEHYVPASIPIDVPVGPVLEPIDFALDGEPATLTGTMGTCHLFALPPVLASVGTVHLLTVDGEPVPGVEPWSGFVETDYTLANIPTPGRFVVVFTGEGKTTAVPVDFDPVTGPVPVTPYEGFPNRPPCSS